MLEIVSERNPQLTQIGTRMVTFYKTVFHGGHGAQRLGWQTNHPQTLGLEVKNCRLTAHRFSITIV